MGRAARMDLAPPAAPLLAVALACAPAPPTGPPAAGPPAAPPPGSELVAPPGASGFGAAVAWGPDALWIAAPFGPEAELYRLPTAASGPATERAGAGPPGAGLHLGPRANGGLYLSSPFHPSGGAIVDLEGAELRIGPGVGGALLAGPPARVAETVGVWVEGEGTVYTPYAPASLAESRGAWVAGMEAGALAAWGPSGEVIREAPGEGLQIALGDFTGSGELLAVIGDPTTGDLRWVELRTGETQGRLAGAGPGLMLSAADHDGDGFDDLLVGWPFAGPTRAGAAALYRGGPGGLQPAARWSGAEPGGWFGAAVALAPDRLAIGAPGGVGRVWVAREAIIGASSGTAPSRR